MRRSISRPAWFADTSAFLRLEVGVLDADASAAWLPLVRDSRGAGQTVVTLAPRTLADNGEWRLLTGLPHERGG